MSDVQVVDCAIHINKKAKLGKNLLDNEYEVLISEVQSRPALWNDCHNDFKNSVVTRKLWNEVGAAVNISGDEAKRKWKNMKDKFRKILQKPQPKSGSAATTPSSKWKFFEMMMFCKDVVLPSRMIGNLMPNIVEEDGSPESDTANNDLQEDSNAVSNCEASSTPRPELQSQQPQKVPSASQNVTDKRFSRPHRSKSVGVRKQEMETKLLKLEEKKINAILSMQNKNEQGDDYHFFMSLLPYVKVLNPLEKLQVRSHIQSIVIEAFSSHESQNAQDYRPTSSLSASASSSSNFSGQPPIMVRDGDGLIDNLDEISSVANAFLNFN